MKEIKKLREGFDCLGKLYPKAPDVKVEPQIIDGIATYWFTPKGMNANRIVIYLHGGSYAYGSIRSHESLITHISNHLHSKILFIEYGLAPENPFPHGLNDVIKVYREILKNYPGTRIDFMGDSAGGGLAISAIKHLIELKLTIPDTLILISPWIDLSCNNPSYEENKVKDVILTKTDLAKFAGIYVGSTVVKTANPKNSDLSKFPPALIWWDRTRSYWMIANNFTTGSKKYRENQL